MLTVEEGLVDTGRCICKGFCVADKGCSAAFLFSDVRASLRSGAARFASWTVVVGFRIHRERVL